MAEAVNALAEPFVKQSKPYCTYKGKLTLGNPEKYDTAMAIDVERYFRTKKATAPSASSFAVKSNLTNQEASQAIAPAALKEEGGGNVSLLDGQSSELAAVKQERTYKVADPTAPGGRLDVEREELSKGYEYGRTAVAISESEQNITKLETKQGLELIGFIPQDKVSRMMYLYARTAAKY